MGWLKNLFRIGTIEDKDGEQTRRVGRSVASLWDNAIHPWKNWNPDAGSRSRDRATLALEAAAVIVTVSAVGGTPLMMLFFAIMLCLVFVVVNVCIRLGGDYRYFRENDELPHGENLDYDKLSDISAENQPSNGVENNNNANN